MRSLLVLLNIFIITSCSSLQKNYSTQEIKIESLKANKLFQKSFKDALSRHPSFSTYIGSKDRYDELEDLTEDFAKNEQKISRDTLKDLKLINYKALDKKTQLSYRLFKKRLESEIDSFKYRQNGFIITQMHGIHSNLPSFMMNMHRIDNESDAKAYIKRLLAFNRVFSETIVNINAQKNAHYPSFIFPKVISDSKNILKGQPFDSKAKFKSTIFKDFYNKVKKLKISSYKKKTLYKEAEAALLKSVKPGYQKIIAQMEKMRALKESSKGIWSQPNGKKYYAHLLKQTTTTNYSPKEIHNIGLAEIKRIHNEMKAISKEVNFKGSLQEFFTHVKNKKDLFYPNTNAGKKAYLKDANNIIQGITKKLDDLFITKPKAKLIVKPVEAYREKSAGIAFYQSPSLTGSRPGIYYVNLSDMSSVAKYDMEALAYHEAIPGHHMQLTIAQELKDIPMFRKFSHYTAYSEGWGLYSELIPKEIGFYKDPYSNFGRLSMELWRAARLVVDTGIHYYKWDYDKAIKYLQVNTPNSNDEISKGIQRYFIMPSQATAYKIGQLKILELKALAKKSLKDKFQIQKFHEVILKNGALPLYELEAQVKKYSQSL